MECLPCSYTSSVTPCISAFHSLYCDDMAELLSVYFNMSQWQVRHQRVSEQSIKVAFLYQARVAFIYPQIFYCSLTMQCRKLRKFAKGYKRTEQVIFHIHFYNSLQSRFPICTLFSYNFPLPSSALLIIWSCFSPSQENGQSINRQRVVSPGNQQVRLHRLSKEVCSNTAMVDNALHTQKDLKMTDCMLRDPPQ